MGSTAASVHTPVGKIDIRSDDGHVTIIRTRAATREERITRPGHPNVVDTIKILFPVAKDDRPVITQERKQE